MTEKLLAIRLEAGGDAFGTFAARWAKIAAGGGGSRPGWQQGRCHHVLPGMLLLGVGHRHALNHFAGRRAIANPDSGLAFQGGQRRAFANKAVRWNNHRVNTRRCPRKPLRQAGECATRRIMRAGLAFRCRAVCARTATRLGGFVRPASPALSRALPSRGTV